LAIGRPPRLQHCKIRVHRVLGHLSLSPVLYIVSQPSRWRGYLVFHIKHTW
jgi:hypothetical protein